MLEGKFQSISNKLEREVEEHHFNPEKGKYSPPAYTEGGLHVPYQPTENERKNCSHAPEDHDCNKILKSTLGGRSHTIICNECPYHPSNVIL